MKIKLFGFSIIGGTGRDDISTQFASRDSFFPNEHSYTIYIELDDLTSDYSILIDEYK